MASNLTKYNLLNSLTIAFADVFTSIFELEKSSATKQPELDEVKSRLLCLLEGSADYILKASVDPRDYDDARFAVCAWVDEVILRMPWAYRDLWQRNLLQNKYYGTVNAGSEFYDRLNILSQDNIRVREVYFICLSLGFKGKYSLQKDAIGLNKIKGSVLPALVDGTQGLTGDKNLSIVKDCMADNKPGLYAEKKLLNLKNNYPLFLLLTPPLLLTAVYFIFSWFLNNVAENITSHVVTWQ